jgi:hypothetical protein
MGERVMATAPLVFTLDEWMALLDSMTALIERRRRMIAQAEAAGNGGVMDSQRADLEANEKLLVKLHIYHATAEIV